MTFLKRILTAPVFEDEAKTQQAYILHVIVWALICVPIPFVIYALFQTPDELTRVFLQAGFGETVNILLLVMLRRGFVRAASIIQVSAFWLFFTVTALTDGGVRGEAYLIGYSLVIAIAGILLGGRGALASTLLSLAMGAFMVFQESRGIFVPVLEASPLTTWIVSFVLFPIGAVLQYLATRTIRNALARARASEERYRLISQVSSDYTFSTVMDDNGNSSLSWVAGAFTEITGYTYEEYVATGGWLGHLHPDDVEKDAKHMELIRQNKKVITEIRTFTKNRELRWVRVYGHPVWDNEKNQLKGIVGAVQDITEQKQVEEALLKSETIYQKAIEIAGAVPYHQTFDSEGRIIYDFIGEGIRQITGYGPEDFNDDLWGSLVLERHLLEDLEPYALDEAIQRVRIGKISIWKCEHCIKARDGKIRWVFEAAVDLRDDEHEIAYGSIGFYQDITEQKLLKEREANRQIFLEKVLELGKQVTEVNDLKTTLERIWHGIHDDIGFDRLTIFLYDQETNTIRGSLGTDHEGRIVEEWEYSRSLDSDKPTSFIRALEQPNGLFYTDNFSLEFEIPEGHEMHHVRDFAAVSARAGDKPVAIITVDNSPTGRSFSTAQLEALRLFGGYAGLAIENSRLNAALQNELDQRQTLIHELETKNAELERFTYTVSHDLKSPLVTITGFLGFLEKDAEAGNKEKVQSSISRITGAAKKMQKLLNDLLELSRIGRLMNPPEDIPFEEIVYEAIDHVHGHLDEVDAVVVVQRDLPKVLGDRIRLVEVVQNLVENAVKYSVPGTKPHIEIGVNGTNEKGYPVFFVRDNGIGIDPQYHERIFGLFNKLDAQSEGTGIGLSLVKRIIEVHNGRIWVESTKGRGSSFYFFLPTSQTKE